MISQNSIFYKPRQRGYPKPERDQSDRGENFMIQQALLHSKRHIFTWYGNYSMVTGWPPTIRPSRRGRLKVAASEISAGLWARLKRMQLPCHLPVYCRRWVAFYCQHSVLCRIEQIISLNAIYSILTSGNSIFN